MESLPAEYLVCLLLIIRWLGDVAALVCHR